MKNSVRIMPVRLPIPVGSTTTPAIDNLMVVWGVHVQQHSGTESMQCDVLVGSLGVHVCIAGPLNNYVGECWRFWVCVRGIRVWFLVSLLWCVDPFVIIL
jgi:hypothetical protein